MISRNTAHHRTTDAMQPSHETSLLTRLPANRQMIEQLAGEKLISTAAKESGIAFLASRNAWAIWIMRLSCGIGLSLVLSSLIYFFAFNWNAIPHLYKLGGLQFALLVCVCTAYFLGLQSLWGQLLVASSAILVGITLAVTGQIYQTGADSYLLFALWGVLILPWTIIMRFAPLWAIWLVVTNLGIFLYWTQIIDPSDSHEPLIFTVLAIMNAVFLLLREYLVVQEKYHWLEGRWIRTVLLVGVLVCILIPTLYLIFETRYASPLLWLSGLLCLLIYIVFFYIYRYVLPDIRELVAVIVFASIILEAALFRLLSKAGLPDALVFLFMTIVTLSIFTLTAIKLLAISKALEKTDAS